MGKKSKEAKRDRVEPIPEEAQTKEQRVSEELSEQVREGMTPADRAIMDRLNPVWEQVETPKGKIKNVPRGLPISATRLKWLKQRAGLSVVETKNGERVISSSCNMEFLLRLNDCLRRCEIDLLRSIVAHAIQRKPDGMRKVKDKQTGKIVEKRKGFTVKMRNVYHAIDQTALGAIIEMRKRGLVHAS